MQPASTIRNWQVDHMQKSVSIIRYLVQTASPDELRGYRDGGDGWTVVEVLCHLRDWEQVFYERARLTVEEENPPLPNPDPDQAASEGRYNTQDPVQALNTWAENREAYLAYLNGLEEAAWMRTAQHPRRGPMTLMDQLILTSWHDTNHIEQISHILAEKET